VSGPCRARVRVRVVEFSYYTAPILLGRIAAGGAGDIMFSGYPISFVIFRTLSNVSETTISCACVLVPFAPCSFLSFLCDFVCLSSVYL